MFRPALAALALAAALAASAARAETYTVVIQSFQFKPQAIDVKPGDDVEFVNKDVTEHTATADDNAFDSKSIQPGASWRWKAGAAGRHAYHCAYHNGMKGVIAVKP